LEILFHKNLLRSRHKINASLPYFSRLIGIGFLEVHILTFRAYFRNFLTLSYITSLLIRSLTCESRAWRILHGI